MELWQRKAFAFLPVLVVKRWFMKRRLTKFLVSVLVAVALALPTELVVLPQVH